MNLIQGKCVDGGIGWVCCLCVCVVVVGGGGGGGGGAAGGRLQDMINTY